MLAKACQVNFRETKLERLEKKISERVKSVPMQTCSSKESVMFDEDRCFFCDETAGSACLHSASTYDFDQKVRKCALVKLDQVTWRTSSCMRTRFLHHHCHWEENFALVTKLTFWLSWIGGNAIHMCT